MDTVNAVALAPFIMLLASLINGFFGRGMASAISGMIGSVATGLAFVLALVSFASFSGDAVRVVLWDFLPNLPVAFAIDQLSLLMVLIITGVGLLINIYSIGYMKGDEGLPRYFSGLNLFIAAMLVLVLADSFLLLFVGWEGVGVCSYLLIGFWYREKLNANAARKAFIVNRIGDVGFLLGMFLTYRTFGTLEIAAVVQAAPLMVYGSATLMAIGLLYMLAAAGKSAQLPLHVWLPDAMAGPTPVSALIHAATMVTAGIYLIARTAPLFAHTPEASAVVAWVGALTAIIAAFSAIAQKDIKKILAYSTISQLGFMFVAVGTGAYWVAIFHVFTHAFFKALLFLASGSVIHALGGEQDIDRMGGLGRRMRVTGTTALIGTLAIAGVPFLSGFFSKDSIMLHTFTSDLLIDYGNYALFAILLLTAVMTAFYMFRWYYRVFGGETRMAAPDYGKVHESPPVMTVPLVILAVLSIFAGYLGMPEFIARSVIHDWLAAPTASGATFTHVSVATEWLLILASTLTAAIGLGLGWFLYVRSDGSQARRISASPVGAASRHGVGFDLAYNWAVVRSADAISSGVALLDREVVDRGMTGVVRRTTFVGRLVVLLQSGHVRLYALTMFTGVTLLALIIFLAEVLA